MAENKKFSEKLRPEREGAENVLRPAGKEKGTEKSRSPDADAAKKAAQKRRFRSESDAAKARKEKFKAGNAEAKAPDRTAAKAGGSVKARKPGRASPAVTSAGHRAVRSANEDDNAGTNAAQLGEGSAEEAVRLGREESYSRKLRNQRRRDARARAEKERQEDSFEGYSSKYKAGRSSAEQASETAKASGAAYEGASDAAAGSGSNWYSKWRQKQDLKKQYAAGRNAASESNSSAVRETAKKAKEKASEAAQSMAAFAKEHPLLLIGIFGLIFLLLIISMTFSSCSLMAGSSTNIVLGSSFTAEDEDILGAEEDYEALEAALQSEIDNIESTYSGYDEYNYDLVEIGHNPYELAALLTVEFEDYTQEEVQDRLQEIFDAQYTLTVEEVVETRTRTEERTGIRSVVDEVTGEITYETYTYEVEVEYDYYILNVTLTNSGITAVAYSSDLTDDQLERYALLLETLGNRSDLFEDVTFAVSTGDYLDYDIPGEALTDEKFANMIAEAEKYLGMAYVWGGSSPSTGFDCSGYVSWVINNCGNGWSVGRLTANGLMGICDIISADEAQPGDLIFFQGTYSTSGASHVGIYVGNGMMIHCGNPISYASIETSYWQEHFYCFGRIRD